MSTYNISGDYINIARESGNKIDKIPVGSYTVEQDPQTGEFFLQKTAPFTRPAKVYGELTSRNKKVINTYLQREGKNTGVILSGTKGAGKTQLAKDVSIALAEQGIPTIIVQDCYTCGGFINFIKAIEDKALILFDEFEKVYHKKQDQESILTLFDGTGSYNKLYIITSNSADVSEFLCNRPSRMYYRFEYKKLAKAVMMDMLADKLQNTKHIPQFETLWDICETISFDVIQCLIEELNRYPEQTFSETFRELNIDIETRDKNSYVVSEISIDGVPLKADEKYTNDFTSFMFMSNYEKLRVFFVADEGTLTNEIKALEAIVHDDDWYCESPSSVKEADESKVKEVEYFFDLQFNPADTVINNTSIVIDRQFGEHRLQAKFVKTEAPDVVESVFGGK